MTGGKITGGPKPTSRLIIRPDPGNELGIYAMWVGSGQPYLLHWGDSSDPTPMTPMRPPTRHIYPGAGRYQIRGVTVDEAHSKAAWVEVPWPDPTPTVEFRGGQLSVGVKWPATRPVGTWRVHWPDWDPEDIDDPQPGTWYTRPALPGGHRSMRVVHLPDGATSHSPPVDVSDVPFSVHCVWDIDGRAITVRRTAPTDAEPERPWHVFWGDEWDGGIARQATAMVNDHASHTYAAAGTYLLEIASRYRGVVYTGVWEVTIP